jgi:carbon starvation protein CstA
MSKKLTKKKKLIIAIPTIAVIAMIIVAAFAKLTKKEFLIFLLAFVVVAIIFECIAIYIEGKQRRKKDVN